MKRIKNKALALAKPLGVIHVSLLLCATKYKPTEIIASEDANEKMEIFCMLISERVLEQRQRLGSVWILRNCQLPCSIQERCQLCFKSFIEFACPYFWSHLLSHLATNTQAWKNELDK